MKVAMFSAGGAPRIGVVEGEYVADVGEDPHAPQTIAAWLEAGGSPRELESRAQSATRRPLAHVRLHAPLPAPRKFLAIGANYASHLDKVAHLGLKIPDHQVWFNKQTSCVTGPADPIVLPRVSSCLDYEGELVVVIGCRCRHVKAADAHRVVGGYLVGNDVSVRDWQMRAFTMTLGKSFDTHGPIGPWLVTPDEIPDPHGLRIRTWINGELRQDGSTAEMRYSIWQQIEELSTVMTLEPGDLLSTGTPAGTAIESHPPPYLKAGDEVRIAIEGIGEIRNTVVAEASPSTLETS